MYNILLVCSAGMSTSLLVTKMEKAAKEQGIEANIKAIAEADLKNNLENLDVLLLGPQVRYMLSKVKTLMEPKGIPVDVINSVDYGTMNGAKVLSHAISMIEGK
ncbi:PTS sugar transporter subunit IIB [Natronincola ferrireducens]|uniref:PTS system, cellobiose-specific IIB component n=1 Tax=Natronincola ferrireducens TaxID=393762 RepID=A0A1G8Z568_9FIRM|nr:PTS sugar transporter subunit IIB [Natronincola ferrireducens]SDK10147.1 PTS system, cellobiose-specific IIB component [Natronincola ferrireducens]